MLVNTSRSEAVLGEKLGVLATWEELGGFVDDVCSEGADVVTAGAVENGTKAGGMGNRNGRGRMDVRAAEGGMLMAYRGARPPIALGSSI